ncbi:hypothetical protein M404DRAFT_1003162 [Pisolithus tinctorius Marx 270]|uniref:Uncharacterized protein n=1 Tax=Pisolithus tinctorius Marx 270 TaxID=870435 RepID=A0A0C3NKI6_PISTI|nr:hypothetical protein M404DRAFT_1003162 [Pisolithus tinctorius Marx 270]
MRLSPVHGWPLDHGYSLMLSGSRKSRRNRVCSWKSRAGMVVPGRPLACSHDMIDMFNGTQGVSKPHVPRIWVGDASPHAPRPHSLRQ